MKERVTVLPNSPTFQQLWDALASKLIEATQGQLSYTQEVRGSTPLPPTMKVSSPLIGQSEYYMLH